MSEASFATWRVYLERLRAAELTGDWTLAREIIADMFVAGFGSIGLEIDDIQQLVQVLETALTRVVDQGNYVEGHNLAIEDRVTVLEVRVEAIAQQVAALQAEAVQRDGQ